jgi:hypothetical protein
MRKLRNIIFLIITSLVLTACGADRAGNNAHTKGVLGVSDSSDENSTDNEDNNPKSDTNTTGSDSNGTKDDNGSSVIIDSDNDGISDDDEMNLYGTNPKSNDTDGDGLSDSDEIHVYGSNPLSSDSDGDGLDDGLEINVYDTNLSNPDTDGDGLSDGDEVNIHESNASSSDSDGDGLEDGLEINVYDTNLSNPDTDGDGLSDGDEINIHDSNASSSDSDGDGLGDGVEITVHDTNLTNPDTDGDGLSDGNEINTYGSDATDPDTDKDGLEDGREISTYRTDLLNPDTDGDTLLDGEEIYQYETNASKVDTDNDGLRDGEEINRYESNATNPDTDNDGLEDGAEVHTHDTNLSNPDTDGDCLLDGFEVLNYNTNPKQMDTDNDTVADGIEIYSYSPNDLNVACLSNPETLSGGHNENPAKDAVPSAEKDKINALDPTNDNDGDGQSNVFENNCTEGDALDITKLCPSILDNELGKLLTKNGYSYIPGGFDVDGDGINEGGFWISRYQARVSGVEIPSETVISDVGNVNRYVSKHFKVLNRNLDVLSYNEATLAETGVVAGSHLIFDEESIAGVDRVSTFTPYLAQVCLERYKLKDEDGNDIDIDITMPTQKQYVHVKMLLDADLITPNESGLLGDGRHVRNGVLGTDPNVPLHNYKLVIDEFGEDLKEYVRNLVQLRQTVDVDNFVDTFTFENDVPEWWRVDKNKFKTFDKGSNATQDLGYGIGPEKDSYAVVVRGGEVLDVTQGVSGALTDDPGQTNGISFRAATDYLY